MNRRLPLLLVAVLATLVSLLGPTAPARAADDCSLTILKTVGEGDTPGLPLGGITFRLNRVLDVAPAPGPALNDLVQADPRLLVDGGSHPLGPDVDVVTDADGRAVAAGLPEGVYLVRELPSRVGDVAYSVITPFLVALPELQGAAREVTVRAKNQPLAIQVAFDQGEVSPGGPVGLSVVASVPAPDRSGRLYRYAVAVTLDPLVQDPRVRAVVLDTADGPVTLDPSQYVVRLDPATNSVIVELTETGLARLAALRAGHPELRVRVQLEGVVAADAPQGERIDAVARLYPDGWQVPADVTASGLAAGAVSQVAVALVVPVAPCPTCQGQPPVEPPAPAPAGLLPQLASTGGAALGVSAGAAVVAAPLWWFLVPLRRRRRDKEEQR